MHRENRMAYWRANLRLVGICLAVWFLCSYGFGVLLVDQLNQSRFRMTVILAIIGQIGTHV